MAQYYVTTTGSNSASGLIGFPWLTIQHALDTMVAGDICDVSAGTYTQNLSSGNSGSAGNYITIQAASGATVTVKPSSGGDMVDFQTVSYVYFKNIIFDGNTTATSCTNMSQACHHNKWEGCTFKNSAVSGVSTQRNIGASNVGQNEFINCNLFACLGHGYYFETYGNIVFGGSIHDVGEVSSPAHGYGVHIYSDAGTLGAAEANVVHSVLMYNLHEYGVLIGGPDNLIYNNVIIGHDPSGSTAYQTKGGVEMGYYTQHSRIDGNRILNNTFYGFTAEGISLFNSDGYTIKNNLFYQCTPNGVYDHHLHGLAGSNTNGSVSDNFNGLAETVDPQFQNEASLDLHLTGHHLGANLSNVFTDDFEGNGRSSWDIGAYEFNGSPPPDPPPGGGLPTDGIFSEVTVDTITDADGTVQIGATLRNSEDVDGMRDHYGAALYFISPDYYTDIYLITNGGLTTLASASSTSAWSSGDVLRLKCLGTGSEQYLALEKNSTTVITKSNAVLPSPDRFGFMLDGNTGEAKISLWQGGTVVSGVATVTSSSSFTGAAAVLGTSHGFDQQNSASVISLDGSGNATCNPRSADGVNFAVAKWTGNTSQPPTLPGTSRIFIRLT